MKQKQSVIKTVKKVPIISVEIMKTIHEREIQKATKEKQTNAERSRGNRSYSERVRAK